jgi:hypothetical protein
VHKELGNDIAAALSLKSVRRQPPALPTRPTFLNLNFSARTLSTVPLLRYFTRERDGEAWMGETLGQCSRREPPSPLPTLPCAGAVTSA